MRNFRGRNNGQLGYMDTIISEHINEKGGQRQSKVGKHKEPGIYPYFAGRHFIYCLIGARQLWMYFISKCMIPSDHHTWPRSLELTVMIKSKSHYNRRENWPKGQISQNMKGHDKATSTTPHIPGYRSGAKAQEVEKGEEYTGT
ncbi:hypothetical protein Tco_0842915 [Tanacetum coccineum]|uniref:Uncharacterized protein n=1 Tax=Tanacetum coccineum TaxID=301880 RepID=A0ABQ5B1T7_9ASTR